jgi:hypothetical protein
VALTSASDAKLLLLHCKEDNSRGGVKENETSNDMAECLFSASLAPHLGLNSFCDFAWEGVGARGGGEYSTNQLERRLRSYSVNEAHSRRAIAMNLLAGLRREASAFTPLLH